jgi:hypothetical protein
VNHFVALLVAAKDPAFNETHPAGAANPGAAVVRQINTVRQRPIEQQVTTIRQEWLVVQGHLADLPHLFHLKTNWPDVPGMPDLTVIEGRDPHEDSGLKRNIVSAVGVEASCHL